MIKFILGMAKVFTKVNGIFRKENEVFNPTKMWEVFKTGTGIFTWVAAVPILILTWISYAKGIVSMTEASTVSMAIIAWVLQQFRSRLATGRVGAGVTTVLGTQVKMLRAVAQKQKSQM